MKERRFLILLMLQILVLHRQSAAQRLNFQTYTTKEGLSQNSVFSIAQTDEGFMWFGTQDGLNRFDGNNFVQVNPVINNQSGVQAAMGFSKQITALLADGSRLVTGTTSELLVYNRFKNVYQAADDVYPGLSLPPHCWILKLARDRQNNIWILSRDKGVFCYAAKSQKMRKLSWPAGTPAAFTAMFIESRGRIWVSSKDDLYYSDNGEAFSSVHLRENLNQPGLAIADFAIIKDEIWVVNNSSFLPVIRFVNNKIEGWKHFAALYNGRTYLEDARIIHCSNDSTIWIGSRSNGLIKAGVRSGKFENAQAIYDKYTLQQPFILSFFTSANGITWVGASGAGVAKSDPSKSIFESWKYVNRPGLPVKDNMILSVYGDNDTSIYMGTQSDGLALLNTRSATWDYYLPKELASNPESKNIYGIASAGGGSLWLATEAGLYNFDKQTKKFKPFFNAADKQTRQLCAVLPLKYQAKMLAGGYAGGLRLFDLKTGLFETPGDRNRILDTTVIRVRYMWEGGNGEVFMATENRALVSYNYLLQQVKLYPSIEKYSNDCRYFFFDGPSLWLATTDGLLQADSRSFTVKRRWTTGDGLPNNYIYAIGKDNNGLLWVSTNKGIASLDPGSGIIRAYGEEDGLNSPEFNTAAVWKSPAGVIWFGCIRGVNNIPEPVRPASDSMASPLLISISVMNRPIDSATATPYLKELRLPYYKNFVSLQFQAPVFSQTQNIQYAYQLTGVDTGWIYCNNRNHTSYTQLKPGSYNFFVKSMLANGSWSKPSVLHIVIYPPWFGTWWFKLLVAAAILFFIIYLIRWRIRTGQARSLVKQKISETEMAALKAQMNPHFMFNCINSIDAFIQSNDKYNATLYLNKFARLIRNILDSSRQNLVFLSKDMETLRLYIELEELRNEGKFTTEIIADPDLLSSDCRIPPLIIQPFVENAILHGLRNRADNNGKLLIAVVHKGDNLEYTVKDNGIGRHAAALIKQQKESSYGMQLSSERVKLFNREKEPSVYVTDLYDGDMAAGTEVLVILKNV